MTRYQGDPAAEGIAAAKRDAGERPDMRRALMIASGLLAALARETGRPETTKAIVRMPDGPLEITIGSALDLADAALEVRS